MYEAETKERDTVCKRCGGEAIARFLDETQQVIEVTCPDCGRFEVPVSDFEQAESDVVQTEERRE